MTNLEVAVFKGLIDEGKSLCYIAHACKYGIDCDDKKCSKCEFYNDVNLCVRTLMREYEEPIGDFLILHEFDKKTDKYTGDWILTKIIYKIENFVGIEQGYCVLGIKVLERGVKND